MDIRTIDLPLLKGLTHLQLLSLEGMEVADLTPLTALMADVTPLASLTELQVLNLFGTSVADVTLLAELTKLKHLSIGETRVRDVSALFGISDLSIDDLPARRGGMDASRLGAVSDVAARGRLWCRFRITSCDRVGATEPG